MQGNVTEIISHLKGFVPEIARREHIRIARARLERVKAKNQDIPYRMIVDGRPAYTENQVKPFGVIKYVFIRLPQIARFAMLEAQNLSPVLSGRYKKSWMFIIDGRPIFSIIDIPNNVKRIILVNFQPYSRKIHVRDYPPGIVEKVKQLVSRRFSAQVKLNIEFIELRGAYILKKNYRYKNRLHTRAGREITYPALIITPRD